VGMGIVPLQYRSGDTAESLGLTGQESFDIVGLQDGLTDMTRVTATAADGAETVFEARVRIDTPQEFEYYCHGGILHYVLRQLAA